MDNNSQNIDKLKQEFIANASHELKTPVTSIQLAVETAITALENSELEDTRKFLNQILKDSQRMTMLLSDLLDLSQLEVNNPIKEIVNLKNIVEAEIGYLPEENKKRNIVYLKIKLNYLCFISIIQDLNY